MKRNPAQFYGIILDSGAMRRQLNQCIADQNIATVRMAQGGCSAGGCAAIVNTA